MNELAERAANYALVKGKEFGKDVFEWKNTRSIRLSKREWVVADTFLRTRNYSECARAMKREFGKDIAYQTCQRWLERGSVKDWIREQIEERGIYEGWSKEHWFKVMTDHIEGRKRLQGGDLYAMKLIGSFKGWEAGDVFNQQINIVQADGKE